MKLLKTDAEPYLLQMHQVRAFEEQAEKNFMAGMIHGNIISNISLLMRNCFDLFSFRIIKDKPVHV